MALTPEEIHNKTFNVSTFKKGYDLDEVDDFLDEIEITVSALVREVADLQSATRGEIPASITAKIDELTSENETLSASLASAQAEVETLRAQNAQLAVASSEGDAAVSEELNNQLAATAQELANVQQALAALEAEKQSLENEKSELLSQVEKLTAHNEELSQGTAVANISGNDASTAAVRLLEIAQRTADETIASARVESDQVLGAASSEAERLLAETTSNIANITREFEEKQLSFDRKIEELRAYEREYRGRLRSYLEGQLRELEAKRLDIELESGPDQPHEG